MAYTWKHSTGKERINKVKNVTPENIDDHINNTMKLFSTS